MEQNTPLREIVPSLIRTYTPAIVGAILGWLTTLGVPVDETLRGLLVAALGAVFTGLYYTAARLLERKFPGLGKLLLGSAKVPVSTKQDNVVQLTAAKNAIEKDKAA